ncbi:hypothetical protein M3231_09270 [Neobacillus mesonae]|nr:hypothetical protein [Neobacillus mesonae]
MRRYTDLLGEPFSFYWVLRTGGRVAVVCPKCRCLAYIQKGMDQAAEVRCTQCLFLDQEKEEGRVTASGVCISCERYFNIEVTDPMQQSLKKINVHCPHCEELNQVPVQIKSPRYYYIYSDIKNGKDPIFQLHLYYSDQYRGKPVWAVNMEHLNYLISYISAELRIKPSAVILRTASHRLPKYMKEAKNRSGIVKTLRKMQYKRNPI